MAITTSYEVYRKRNNDWAVLFAHTDREEALDRARGVIRSKPSSIVQVIEERLDSETNESRATIIFRGGQAKPKEEPVEAYVPRRRRRRLPPPHREHPISAFIRSAIIVVLSICGISLAALIGLAILVDLVR